MFNNELFPLPEEPNIVINYPLYILTVIPLNAEIP